MQVQSRQGDKKRSVQDISGFIQELVACMSLDLTAESREDDGVVHIDLKGPDRPLLLSNAALLLNSIEYLLNKAFPGSKEESPGISLDSDNYRQHRELELKLLAQMASQKVISIRKPLSLQPMVPRERRIVHMALAEIQGVRSQSEGEGENRSITIFPS